MDILSRVQRGGVLGKMMTYTDSLELEHFGVKGMKWGVRRYQNADGTLTAAGKEKLKKYKFSETTRVTKRRDKAQVGYEVERHKRKGKGLTKASSKELRKKELMKIYNKELEEIKRMKFKDMQSDKIAVGQAWARSAMKTGIGTVAATALIGPGAAFISVPTPSGISNAKTRNRMKRYEQRTGK